MADNKKSVYEGDLGQYLPRRERDDILGLPDSDPAWDKEMFRRFKLLLEHHGLERGDRHLWIKLSFALILEHVPGLQEAPPSNIGRPRTRHTPEARAMRAQLLEEVDAIRKDNPRMMDASCIKYIFRKPLPQDAPLHPLAEKSDRMRRNELHLARQERRLDALRKFIPVLEKKSG